MTMARTALESMLRSFATGHPADAARALESLSPEAAAEVLQKLSARVAGAVLERIAARPAAAILTVVGPERTRDLLSRLGPRQAAAILHNLEDAAREAAMEGVAPSEARRIQALLQYPPDTAGGMMEPQITTISEDLTASQAVAVLRKAPRHTLYYLYVTDRDGRLAGVLNMRELLLAAPRDPIAPLVHRDVLTVLASLPRDEVAALVRQRRFVALPVVDSDGFLLGVVKPDEILDALQQEAFADLQKMVGAGEDERALSPVTLLVRKRLPWLYVNLVTAFLAAAVVGVFEATIQQVTALAVLLPVVAGQGGNTGAQALAVVMRGLALRELVPGTTRRLLVKEVLGAFLNGVGVAVVTGLAVYLWDGRVGLMLIIALAMVVNMTAAGLAGAAIPLILRAAGRDPAQSASIFLTTVTDIVGFAAFLGFAVLLMPMLT
jgi:magnesium transporter